MNTNTKSRILARAFLALVSEHGFESSCTMMESYLEKKGITALKESIYHHALRYAQQDYDRGVVRVTCAQDNDDQSVYRLVQAFCTAHGIVTGDSTHHQLTIEPSLIAGFTIQAQGLLYDASLKTQRERLALHLVAS